MRRLTVALSRARLGLYILGRREVFESCYELQEAFSRLLARPDKLKLVVGEMFPATRSVDAVVEDTEMDGVEHLGKYVHQMTQAKVASLKAGNAILPAVEDHVMEEEDDVDVEVDVDVEEDDDEGV